MIMKIKLDNDGWVFECEHLDGSTVNKPCPHLYDVLREVIANSDINYVSKRMAISELVRDYFGDDCVITSIDKKQ